MVDDIKSNDCKKCICNSCVYKESYRCREEDMIRIAPCDGCSGTSFGYCEILVKRGIKCLHRDKKII